MIHKPNQSRIILILITTIALSIFLAALSDGFSSIQGWTSFFLVGSLAAILSWFSFKLFAKNNSLKWVLGIFLIAIFLRLGMGSAAYYGLPKWGHTSCDQQLEIIIDDCPEPNGYIFRDAYKRDLAAWDLAHSDEPLISSFNDYSTYDQYGGLLFISSFIYKYVSPSNHSPLLIVFFGSIISSLAVVFTWGFAIQFNSEKVGKIAAVIVALYPEAIILGSSQMREAFTIPLFMLGFFLLAKYGSKVTFKLIAKLGLITAILFAFSIPTGILFLGILFLLSFEFTDINLLQNINFKKSFILTIPALLIGIWVFRDHIPALKDTLHLQAYYAERSSGHLQSIFKILPGWLHTPFLTFYGIFRPLLPATIIATGNPLWKAIIIWRSLGWTILLVFLIYGIYLLSKKYFPKHKLLMVSTWFVIVISSFRGGGDDWDNPRYRVILIGFQAILFAWALSEQKETSDPWLKRIFYYAFSLVGWIMVWYIPKYISENNVFRSSIFNVILLGLLTGTLFSIKDAIQKKN